jgi:hypothetical protein
MPPMTHRHSTKSAPTPYEQASMSAAAPGVTVFLTALSSHAHTSSDRRRDFLRMLSLLLRHIRRLVIMASIDLGDFRIPPRGPEACSASRPVTSSSMRESAASRSTQPGTPCRSVIQFDSAHSQRPSMSASVSVPARRIATAGGPRQPVRLLQVHRVQGSVEDELMSTSEVGTDVASCGAGQVLKCPPLCCSTGVAHHRPPDKQRASRAVHHPLVRSP